MAGSIRGVTVVGAGTLGTQIGVLAACFGYDVRIYDAAEGAFEAGVRGLLKALHGSRREPIVPIPAWEEAAGRVRVYRDLGEALAGADLVIEAVPEDLALKREVFRRIDDLAPDGALLATNSSSIPVSRLESATRRAERCLNLHFYIPALGLNMVDVMGGTRTTPETLEAGREWVRSIGCVPLAVNKEILGFCFNRVWRAVKREVLHMWAEGFVDFRDIDRAWMIFTGMDRGPFGLMDSVGLDVVHDIEMVYFRDSGDPRDRPPAALASMLAQNQLGVKTQQGFYTYPEPEYSQEDFLKG